MHQDLQAGAHSFTVIKNYTRAPFSWNAMAQQAALWDRLLLRQLRPTTIPNAPLSSGNDMFYFPANRQFIQQWPSFLNLLASHFLNFQGRKQSLIPTEM